MNQQLIERWTRYAMKIQCKACGEEIYAHEEDARSDIEHILSTNDFGSDPSIRDLRDALTWLEHGGKYCDYHTEMENKDD
jgi:hypothetical protein